MAHARRGWRCTRSTPPTSTSGSVTSNGSKRDWRRCGAGARRLLPPQPTVVHGGRARPALDALATHGHDVRLTDLYADGFEPAMSCDERRTHKGRAWPRAPALRRRPALGAGARARLPDVVEWAAGDAQGLDRPGVGGRRGVGAPAGSRRRAAAAQRPPYRRDHRARIVELVNALEGRVGQAHDDTFDAGDVRAPRTTWCAVYGLDTADEGRASGFWTRWNE